jgi:hypothetical protein
MFRIAKTMTCGRGRRHVPGLIAHGFTLFIAIAATSGISSSADVQPPAELHRWLTPQRWHKDVGGPVISLGDPGKFDDMHIFAPAVVDEDNRFSMWYCGSRGSRATRVFRLGLATSADGKIFARSEQNPVHEFKDGVRSVLTPCLLRNGDGRVIREEGKLRMWHSAADLAKGGLHTLHESSSADGVHWKEPSPALMDHVYCPTILKTDKGYEMWFSDIRQRPWVIRHAASADGRMWNVTERPVLQLSQDWEAEILVYPTVLHVDGVYLMWYGSYYSAVRRQTTAIGFAVSRDGLHWYKHSQNPVITPDPKRPWESNYVGSGCVMRLADGSYRYWYASRKAPPFENLYFAINTARWAGPEKQAPALPLPPRKGDKGVLPAGLLGKESTAKETVRVLEVVDKRDAIIRVWYQIAGSVEQTFVDLWIHGLETSELATGSPAHLPQVFQVTGNRVFDTTCGKRSLPLLEPVADAGRPP